MFILSLYRGKLLCLFCLNVLSKLCKFWLCPEMFFILTKVLMLLRKLRYLRRSCLDGNFSSEQKIDLVSLEKWVNSLQSIWFFSIVMWSISKLSSHTKSPFYQCPKTEVGNQSRIQHGTLLSVKKNCAATENIFLLLKRTINITLTTSVKFWL